ncbi:unnamed protein product [Effrenium voratum]|nr:unnamed protein product [Effrenium voratum]
MRWCAQEFFWAIGEDDPPKHAGGFLRKPLEPKAYEESPNNDQRMHLFAAIDVDPFEEAEGCGKGEMRLATIGKCVPLPKNHIITKCPETWGHDYGQQLKECVFDKVKQMDLPFKPKPPASSDAV